MKPSLIEVCQSVILICDEIRKANPTKAEFEVRKDAIVDYNNGQMTKLFKLAGNEHPSILRVGHVFPIKQKQCCVKRTLEKTNRASV